MRPVVVAAIAMVAPLLLASPPAPAELTRQAGLVISFEGRLRPAALPRHTPAPVSVSLGGRVRSADGAAFPQLRRVVIAINRHGRFDFRGIPACRLAQVRHASAATALANCRASLVGRGRFGALIALPEQARFRVRGRLQVFNARHRGRRALLTHLYTPFPLSISVTVPLSIERRRAGPYGTLLRSPLLPELLGHQVYATDFRFALGRRFASQGVPRSYLRASCPAPRGFPGALFALARATYRFDGSRTVRQTLTRECRVRR